MLVRGKDNFNNFELEPRPIKDLHPSAMRAHAHSMVVRDLNTGHNILRRENYSLKTQVSLFTGRYAWTSGSGT